MYTIIVYLGQGGRVVDSAKLNTLEDILNWLLNYKYQGMYVVIEWGNGAIYEYLDFIDYDFLKEKGL